MTTLNSADAPQHVTPNGEVALDGLCVIGRLTRTERRGASADFEGFLTGYVQTSKGEIRIDISRTANSIVGSVDLPAYDKLNSSYAAGKLWCISVAASRGGDKNQYTNLTAIDATEL